MPASPRKTENLPAGKRSPGKSDHILLRSEANRLSTFRNWPSLINKKALAEAGFYYFNQEDACQCIYCFIIISDWDVKDNPIEEHKKWKPNCPFILKLPVGNIPITQSIDEAQKPDLSSFTYPCHVWGRTIDVRPFAEIDSSSAARVVADCGCPQYTKLSHRQASFKYWPRIKQTADEMVQAGFYYTGRTDRVKCYKCKIDIHDWRPDDCPSTRHKFLSPHCPLFTA
jgi:hypothetical protein